MNRMMLISSAVLVAGMLAGCSSGYPGLHYAANGPAGVSHSDASAGQASMSNACPGTNEAGAPWQPGEYCLPGGR